MKRIKVTHFLQDSNSTCAVAAASVVANFYNSNISYEKVKDIAYRDIDKEISKDGMDSAQICMLFNYIGFQKVTLITSDFSTIDYTWSNYSKRKMGEVLKKTYINKKDKEEKETSKNLYDWHTLGYDNKIIIDYNFSKYIKSRLNKKKPLVLSFNWTMFFKFAKEGKKYEDTINGETQEHAVVVNGYDDKGVWIVDSHHQNYKYKRKKYRKGFYKMSWENLMTCMGQGDVIIPDNYIGESA